PPGHNLEGWGPQGYPYTPPGYNQGVPPYGQPWQPYAPGRQQSNGMGTAGFVLALVSMFIGWVPLVGWLIWILGAVFSFIGLFRQPRGLAIAGVVISLVLIPMIVTLLVALDALTSAMFLL
ncbi:MAG: hypothetical protein K2G84_05620, partial [Muribaculaceae bacterium]|nr:hypothetical protein [Muribaculaceae bacterium]